MNAFRLIAAFIARKPVSWTFHILILAASLAVLVAVGLVRDAADRRLQTDLAGIDLVVGAKGSPLQLVMSAVLEVDVATGTIPISAARRLAHDPLIATATPVSIGDSVNGFRIVGATHAYPALYDARIAKGRFWSKPMEAVVGADAARATGLKIGDVFHSEHGLGGGDAPHEVHPQPYVVVGIMAPTGSVLDRLVLTDLASVWRVHDADPDHPHTDEHQVTAVLIRYRSPLGAVILPRRIGAEPGLIAASPAREATRLNALAGIGARTLTQLGSAFLGLSAFGFVLALASAVLSRRRDLAVLRTLGASTARVVLIVTGEGALLGLLGGLGGVALGRLASTWIAHRSSDFRLPISGLGALELSVILGALALGAVAALIMALLITRADPLDTLTGEGR